MSVALPSEDQSKSRSVSLYRHFDEDDNLLYVGIAVSAPARLARHAGSSHWAYAIRRVSIEVFATRDLALLAERAAIKKERPAHNIRMNSDPVPDLDRRVTNEAGQINDAIGAQVLADTFDVTHSAIRKRRELNEFPAQWYHRMEVMGIERGITIPRYLFSFKGMAK